MQNYNGCYVNLSQTTSHRMGTAEEEINFIDENKDDEHHRDNDMIGGKMSKCNGMNEDGEHPSTVYNFPWDFKLGNKPLMLQTQLSNVPNAHSTVLDSSSNSLAATKVVSKPDESTINQDEQDENQYCAPWDLKLQENMLKLMASSQQQTDSVLNENHSSVNKRPEIEKQPSQSKLAKPTLPTNSNMKTKEDEKPSPSNTNNSTSVVEEESNEYSLPWEHKQPFLMQRLTKESETPEPSSSSMRVSSSANKNPTAPVVKNACKSVDDSGLVAKNQLHSDKFNRNQANRLSTRSNHSNSSSAHSSSSSLSINSPPLLTNSNNQPILLPQTFTSTLNDQSSGVNTQTPQCMLPANVQLISPNFSGEAHCKCGHNSQKPGFNQTQHLLISQPNSNNGQISSVLVPVNMANNLLNGMSIISATPGTTSNKTSHSNLSFATAGSLTPMNSGSCLNDTTKTWKTTNTVFDSSTTSKNPNYPCSSTQIGYPSSNFSPTVLPNQFGTGISLISNDMKMAFPTGTILLSTNPHNHLGLLQSQNSSSNLFTLNHPQCHLLTGASNLGAVGGWSSQLPSLEDQLWYHGRLTRKEAENLLANRPMGSFLVRQSETGNSNDFSLSLVGSGCVHMRICMKNGEYILGQCSQPFKTIVQMIEHYRNVEVPIKGAQHVKLTSPVAAVTYAQHA